MMMRLLCFTVSLARRARCLLTLPFLLTACETLPEEEALRARNRLLQEQKAASLTSWPQPSMGGRSAERYARDTVVRVLPAAAVPALRRGWVKGGGTAVALTPDGYYLTAAHNIGRTPLVLAYPNRKGWRTGRIRVVWTGRSLPQGPDVAVVHSPLRSPLHAPLAPWMETMTPQAEPLLSAGWGTDHRNPATPHLAAGRLERVGPARSGTEAARWRRLWHSLPLVRGDSGAPLFNTRGEIIGLHTGGEYDRVTRMMGRERLQGWTSVGIQPDAHWIQTIIARDRTRQR